MKLYYCHIPEGNFGDDLNAWLWPKLLPSAFDGTVLFKPHLKNSIVLDDPREELFLGIGTLIRRELPQAATKRVFGSGYGYGDLPAMDGSWDIHCVRGPVTARALGIADSKAITDPAVLVRLLPREAGEKTHRFSFIPHWEMARSGDWERVCRGLGINYIDPRWTAPRVIGEIGRTHTLITEALHGAIVADALRVPWVPVASQHTVLSFKWRDWCESIGRTYSPAPVPAFWLPRPGPAGWVINTTKRLRAASILSGLMRRGAAVLSDDGVMERLTDRLLSTLAAFCKSRGFTLNTAP